MARLLKRICRSWFISKFSLDIMLVIYLLMTSNLFSSAAPKRPEAASYHNEKGTKAWLSIYDERNRKFGTTDWDKEASS